jgi:hypothetical protein
MHADSMDAAAHGTRTRVRLAVALGDADTVTELHWWGAAWWRQQARWQTGDLIVAAAVAGPYRSLEPSRVLVAAAGRSADVQDSSWRFTGPAPQRSAEQRAFEQALLQDALGLLAREQGEGAEIGVRLARSIGSFLGPFGGAAPGDRQLTREERNTFVDAVEDWARTAADLTGARRAAGLLAIDLLLDDFAQPAGLWDRSQSALRSRLEVAGAEFLFSPLGDAHVYTRSFLRRAVAADSVNRAGELAFLALMQLGFETSGTCRDQNGLGFRAVIANGEAFLRARPRASIRTDVHFMVARAYSDFVAIARGAGYHLTDAQAAQYQREGERARMRAIDEYRAGFSGSGASRLALDSWPDAWRLLAGLGPSRTYFYCIYD